MMCSRVRFFLQSWAFGAFLGILAKRTAVPRRSIDCSLSFPSYLRLRDDSNGGRTMRSSDYASLSPLTRCLRFAGVISHPTGQEVQEDAKGRPSVPDASGLMARSAREWRRLVE